MRIKILPCIVLLLAAAGCARVKGTVPATPEQNLATVMDVVNGELSVATDYYSAQKIACAKPVQPVCRFSADGLEAFRLNLLKANDLFMIAAKDFLLYKQTRQNFPAVQDEVMNAAASVATLPKEAR